MISQVIFALLMEIITETEATNTDTGAEQENSHGSRCRRTALVSKSKKGPGYDTGLNSGVQI